MTTDIALYERLRENGFSPKQAAIVSIQEGKNTFETIQLLRKVYNLDLPTAKDALVQGELGLTLDQYQAQFLRDLKEMEKRNII